MRCVNNVDSLLHCNAIDKEMKLKVKNMNINTYTNDLLMYVFNA